MGHGLGGARRDRLGRPRGACMADANLYRNLGSTVFRAFFRPDLHLVGYLFFAAQRVASAKHAVSFAALTGHFCIAWLNSAVLDFRSRRLSSTTSQLFRGGVRNSSETWKTAHI